MIDKFLPRRDNAYGKEISKKRDERLDLENPPSPTKNLSEKVSAVVSKKNVAITHHAHRLPPFTKLFSHDDKVLIIITADPDSIASAVALKRLLWRKVSHILVASTNVVRRPDNLKLVQSLKLTLPLLENLKLEDYTKLAMVDSQPHHSPQTASLHFTLVVDHHPIQRLTAPEKEADYSDIRPDWGATSTILLTYLRAARIKPNQILATALFYAIKTDTLNFVRQGQLEDMIAFRWLYPHIHHQLLSEIERAPIDRSAFKVMLKALNQAYFFKQYAYVFVEKLDHSDTLVLMADFVMQINDVNRVIISGVFQDKLVIILRSAGLRSNLGRLAEEAFGDLGSAGGHKNMARAEIPLSALESKFEINPSNLGRFVNKRIKEVMAVSKKI